MSLTRTISPRVVSLTATPSGGQVVLTWTRPVDTFGAVSQSLLRVPAFVAPVNPTGQTYTDTAVTGGVTYTYILIVTDARTLASAPQTVTALIPNTSGPDFIVQAGSLYPNTTAGIAAAIAAAGPGKIIELRCAVAGTTEAWTAIINVTGKSGTPGNPIVLRVRSGDTVRLAPTAANSGILLSLTNCHYWVIQGSAVPPTAVPSTFGTGLVFGDITRWVSGNPFNSYPHNQTMYLNGCSWIGVRNVSFTGSRTYFNVATERNCDFLTFEGVYGQLHGSNNAPVVQTPESGDLFHLRSRHTRVQFSRLAMGGHNAVAFHGSFCVMRECEVSSDWRSKATGQDTYRAMEFSPGQKDKWRDNATAQDEFGPGVCERTKVSSCNPGTTGTNFGVVKYQGAGVIARNNLLVDTPFHAITGPSYEGSTQGAQHLGPCMRDIRLYHLTTYNTNSVYLSQSTGPPWIQPPCVIEDHAHVSVQNSLCQQVHTGRQQQEVFYAGNAGVPKGPYPTHWKGGVISHNTLSGDSVTTVQVPSPVSMAIRLNGTGAGCTTLTNSSLWASNVFANVLGDLAFANPAARTFAGFALSSTNAASLVDAAPLTTIAAVTDATRFRLAEGTYFKGNWSMLFAQNLKNGFEDEPTDWIAIGPLASSTALEAVPTRILSLNTVTGEVVASAPVACVVGSPVFWAGNGALPQVHTKRGAVP